MQEGSSRNDCCSLFLNYDVWGNGVGVFNNYYSPLYPNPLYPHSLNNFSYDTFRFTGNVTLCTPKQHH